MSEEWMSIWVVVPPDEGAAILEYLRKEHRFPENETNWCENERGDFAFYDYAPFEKPQGSRYA